MKKDQDQTTVERELKLLKVRQVAEWLGLSEKMLWTITVPRGKLRCVRIKKSLRYNPEDVKAYIKNQTRGDNK